MIYRIITGDKVLHKFGEVLHEHFVKEILLAGLVVMNL